MGVGEAANAILDLEGVHKHYQTDRVDVHALRGVDLRIATGDYLSIMGPSGSGKTTMLEILGLLSPASAGTVRFQGRPTSGLDVTALAHIRSQEIGFVFQAFNLLPRLSAVENVELPLVYQRSGGGPGGRRSRKDRKERAIEALRRVGLESRAGHLPGEMSGGERQRVAVARALVNDPAVILADEPTGNLDSKTGEEVLSLFDALHEQGGTLVVVTHDERVGARAARTVSVRDGVIERDD